VNVNLSLFRLQTVTSKLYTRLLSRPGFSGRHDFGAEKFGRQCAKSGSHSVGLQENWSKIIT